VLGALAQETRLAVFRRLVQAGPGGLTPGELSRALEIPPPTLSFHLRALGEAGLVAAEREGRSLRYAPDYDVLNGAVAFLMANCCRAPGRPAPSRGRAKPRSRRARG